MSAVVSALVYILIGVFVFRTIRKQKGGAKNQKTVTTPSPVVPERRRKNSGVNAHMAREKINIRGWEDRKNDWLARQMAEEKTSLRKMSEMFQMKMEHRYNCEAEMLKQFHETRCEAGGVDKAEIK